MSDYASIQHTLADELRRLNEHIEASLHSPNELINAMISHHLKQRGKQIRPVMVMLVAKMLCGHVNDRVLNGAVAVELLHNASLIHDDVVDDTTMRRGNATINSLWDNHLAVLIGDFFLSNALLQGVKTDDIRILGSLSNLGKQLSVGELDEIYNSRYTSLSEDTYFNIIYRKTASLFVSCVEVAAYGASADQTQLEALREYGKLIGLCFQIQDDIFDYFPDASIGKPTGNDLREGKVTLPLIHALADENTPNCQAMRQLAMKDTLCADEIALLVDFAHANGGIEYAREQMKRLRDQAVQCLEIFPPGPEHDALISLIDYIISRTH